MTVMPNIVINTSNISKGQSKAVTARITHWIMRFIGHLSKVAAGRTLQPATRDRCRCRVRLHRQWAGLRDGLWRPATRRWPLLLHCWKEYRPPACWTRYPPHSLDPPAWVKANNRTTCVQWAPPRLRPNQLGRESCRERGGQNE